jgi:septum formation protein
MLELQSGNKTSVITCMIYKSKEKEIIDISITTYEFLPFDKKHMQEYLDSGECFGKAGAIMVEGFCKPYIKNVIGYESTAMGLCVEKLNLSLTYKKNYDYKIINLKDFLLLVIIP